MDYIKVTKENLKQVQKKHGWQSGSMRVLCF